MFIEYWKRFIVLMAPLTGVPQEISKGQFINGLRKDVRAEVRLFGPISLDHAMDLSLKVEDKLKSGLGRKLDLKETGLNYFTMGQYSLQLGNPTYIPPKSQSNTYSPSN